MQQPHYQPSTILSFGYNPPVITLVCCLHGDESFGETVFNYFKEHASRFGDFKLILAHPAALQAKKRFFEDDMNRSFPGSPEGSIESRLAHSLLPEIQDCSYLVDIHTTVSDVKMAPIITSLNKITRRLINACPAREVAFVQPPLSTKSMIGQVQNGISLEYNVTYAKTQEALQTVIDFITLLLSQEQRPTRKRKVFYIDDTIAKSVKIPQSTKNFYKIRGLNVYPFLYHKDSYPTIHALSASKMRYMTI